MNTKIIMLGIAIVAIGLVALPQTMALFKGQHEFYATTAGTDGLPCQKCHQDIIDAYYTADTTTAAYGGHTPAGSTITTQPQGPCEFCHVIGPGAENYTQGTDYHAAVSPLCVDCHRDGNTVAALSASALMSGLNESHRPFALYMGGTAVTYLNGANEACVACHTHVPVNITWTKYTTMSFDAQETAGIEGTGKWTVDNFNVGGEYIVKTVGDESGSGTFE